MTTKVSTLTYSNVSALKQAIEDDDVKSLTPSNIQYTATTATFANDSHIALDNLNRAIEELAAKYGRRGHPVQSLQAVRRKLEKLAKAEVPLP